STARRRRKPLAQPAQHSRLTLDVAADASQKNADSGSTNHVELTALRGLGKPGQCRRDVAWQQCDFDNGAIADPGPPRMLSPERRFFVPGDDRLRGTRVVRQRDDRLRM